MPWWQWRLYVEGINEELEQQEGDPEGGASFDAGGDEPASLDDLAASGVTVRRVE